MPAAATKTDLLAVTERDWTKLRKLLDDVPEALACAPQGGDPSIRDIVTHRAHWIGLFFQWLAEGAAAEMPDHGVKWNGLKSYNADLRQRYGGMEWADALTWLDQSHAKLRDWIAATDEADLYGGPMPGGTGWTRGRYAEAAGASHYRSAAKYVRAVLRQAKAASPN